MQRAVSIIDSIINQFDPNEDIKQQNDTRNNYKSHAIKQKYNINPDLFDFIDQCMTENRYNTIISALGTELNVKNARKAIGMMTGNVFQQLIKSKQEEISKLEKNEKEILKKYTNSCVQQFFNPKLSQLNTNIKHSAWIKDIWCKYGSIENNSKKVTQRVIDYGLNNKDTKWAVTEKVHGANFAIIYNGKEFGAAKRTSILHEHEQFYPGWQDIVENQKVHIEKAYNLLKQIDDKIEIIIIYGELFGGLYMHKDKKYAPKHGVKHVQKGVYYSPALHFYAFDIRTNFTQEQEQKTDDKNKKKKRKSIKLEFHITLDILKKSGFLYCEPIMIGTFDECLNFDVETFQTTIPSKLGLPPAMDPTNCSLLKNIAEGIVLRKLNGRNMSIKIKSTTFHEVTGTKGGKLKSRYRGKTKKSDNKEDVKNKAMEKYKLDLELFDFIERCVNKNRYEAVISKVGILSLQNARKVMGMMAGDVYQELNTVKFDEVNLLEKDAKNMLKKYNYLCVTEFFAPKLLELDNELENE